MPTYTIIQSDIERLIRKSFIQEHPELQNAEFHLELRSLCGHNTSFIQVVIDYVDEEPDEEPITTFITKARLTALDYEKLLKPD